MGFIRIVPVAFLCWLPVLALGATKDRDWQQATLLSVDKHRFTTQSDTTTTQGQVSGNSYSGTSQQYSWNHERITYVVDSGQFVYVASHVLSFRWSKPAKVTVNGPVWIAISKGKLYLRDEDEREHKLEIEQKILKTGQSSKSSTVATGSGGELKVGMSVAEVESILGPPSRQISFENKLRWTYSDVIVLFEDGKVAAVEFP